MIRINANMIPQSGIFLKKQASSEDESARAVSSNSLPMARIHRSESLTPAELACYYRTNVPTSVTKTQSKNAAAIGPMHSEPVSTSKCFQNFKSVVERLEQLGRITGQQELDLESWKQQRNQKKRILRELCVWRHWQDTQLPGENYTLKSWWKALLSEKPKIPEREQLVDLAKHFYPRRADVKIHICDFGPNRFERTETTLADIEQYLERNGERAKPLWADVRWIHAPLNVGLVQSSLEDRFLKERREPGSDAYTRNVSWPFAQVETISIRQYQELVDMQTIFQIFNQPDNETIQGVVDDLDKEASVGIDEKIEHDIRWRAGHWGKSISHWNLTLSDFPRQMSNSSAEFIDPDYTSHVKVEVEKQALSNYAFFRNAHLIRSNFRCFHNSDGSILTMCADNGIDYIDQDLEKRLGRPSHTAFEDEEGSLIGHMLSRFSKTGSSTWYKRNVDWFLIYLLTEIVAKPHNIRQGCNAPSLGKAYQNVIQDLKTKRFAQFKRGDSVNIVKEYVACIDEISTLVTILARNEKILDQLKEHAKILDEKDVPGDSKGEKGCERVKWASEIVKDQAEIANELLIDLQKSREALFQIRSIEQNELAIVADSQNKAILAFTVVTVVFMPLSFFTSYFGMNLKGIQNTDRTEIWFWRVFGSLSFCFISLLAMYILRKRIAQRLRSAASMTFPA